MKVRCNEGCDTLTAGKEYGDDKYTIPECGNCYFIRGNDGVERHYSKSRFEEVKGMLNGKFVVDEDYEDIKKGSILEFKNGGARLKVNEGERFWFLYSDIKGLKMKVKQTFKAWELEKGKVYDYNEKLYKKVDGEIFRYYEGINSYWELNRMTYKEFSDANFIEINPNKERIEELKKLIKDGAFEIENLNREMSAKDQLVNSYEAELKELEQSL